MARSRNRSVAVRTATPPRRRWNWRRVFGGLAEFFRNIALVAVTAPFVEPLFTGAAIDEGRAVVGGVFGFAFLTIALILDYERRD